MFRKIKTGSIQRQLHHFNYNTLHFLHVQKNVIEFFASTL